MRQLGIGEEHIRNDAAARRSTAALEIGEHDAEVIFASMCELKAPGALASGPNIGRCGLQSVVDADVAARIDFNSCSVEIESIRVRCSAGCNENVGGFQRSLTRPRTHQQRNHST